MKNVYKIAPGSYRFRNSRLGIELWLGRWELLDLESPSRETPVLGIFASLKDAIRAAETL